MNITFSCKKCQSSFTVDSQLAGRTAKCRKCGERLVIPAPQAARQPAVARSGKVSVGSGTAAGGGSAGRAASSTRKSGVGAAEALRRSAGENTSRSIGWMDAVNSQVGLKPITMMAARVVSQKEIDEWDDPRSQYKVVIPSDMRKKPAVVTKPAEIAVATYFQGIRSYRQLFNLFVILSRWINETAYAISLIFLITAIVGSIMGKPSLVTMGLSMVVLLNVIQLAAGVFNLIAIQFRGNVAKGLLFLFPPITVFNLWKNWYRWQKPIGRITTPIVWLVVLAVAYRYIPWLNGTKKGPASFQEAVETIKKNVGETVKDLKQKGTDLKEKLPAELEKGTLDDLQKKAGETLEDLKAKGLKAIEGSGSSPPGGGVKSPP